MLLAKDYYEDCFFVVPFRMLYHHKTFLPNEQFLHVLSTGIDEKGYSPVQISQHLCGVPEENYKNLSPNNIKLK
jgi:transposase